MKFIFGVCLGALIGTIIEGLKDEPKMITIIVFGSLTAFFGLIILVGWLSKYVWPGREKWWATSSCDDMAVSPQENPQNALSNNRGQIWRSPSKQELEAWFEVDMGKPRMIANIEFLADSSGVEKPAKWRMMFYGEGRKTLKHKDGKHFIRVEGDAIPKHIQYFRAEIKEAAANMPADTNYAKWYGQKVSWTISAIRLKEYRFSIFGRRFWKHEL